MTSPTPPPSLTPVRRKLSFGFVVESFRATLRRFPLTAVYVFAVMLWSLVNIWTDTRIDVCLNAAMWFAVGVGVPLTLAVSLWCEYSRRDSWLWIAQAVANVLLVADAVYIFYNYHHLGKTYGIAHAAILSAILIAVFFVPAAQMWRKSRLSWYFSFRQFGNFIVSAILLPILLEIALWITVGTVYLLFSAENTEVNLSLSVIIGLIPAFIFLGNIPVASKSEGEAALYTPDRFTTGLVKFLFVPIVAVYMTVLYIYGLKVLFLWELPKGVICWSVTGLSAAVILVLFILESVRMSRRRDGQTDKYVEFVFRALPIALLPLLVLMSVAIGYRVWEYGLTVSRLYVITFNIWAYFAVIYLIVTNSSRINILPLSFAVIFLATSIIPGFNYTSLTHSYMRHEVRKQLRRVGVEKFPVDKKDFVAALQKLDVYERNNLNSRLRELDSSHDHSLTSDIVAFDVMINSWQCDEAVADERFCADTLVIEKYIRLEGIEPAAIPQGYDSVRHLRSYSDGNVKDDGTVEVECDDYRITFDTNSFSQWEPKKRIPEGCSFPVECLVSSAQSAVFVPTEITYYKEKEKFDRFSTFEGYIFIKR